MGSHLGDVCREVVQTVQRVQKSLKFIFNGVIAEAEVHDSVDNVLHKYDKACEFYGVNRGDIHFRRS